MSKNLSRQRSRVIPRHRAVAAALFLAALALFCINSGFRLGLHLDEVAKVRAITSGEFRFYHPLLMVEVTRLAALLLRATEPQAIVEVGRALSACIGAIGIAALFLLMRRRVGEMIAIIVSLAAMLTPLVAVHAHYLKEDIWLFGSCALAVLAFRQVTDECKLSNIILLGLSLGLAISSKAIGAFLILAFALAALLQPSATRWHLLKSVGLASAGAFGLVVFVNLRMVFNIDRASADFSSEIRHAVQGSWDQVSFPVGYHLSHSIVPGIGPVLLVLAILGLIVGLAHWRRADPIDRLMMIYALVYYALIEGSPLKSGVDMVRYAVPLVLPTAFFAGIAMDYAARWLAEHIIAWSPEKTLLAAPAAIAVALVPTAVIGARLVAALPEDTRIVAEDLLAGRESQVVTEAFGTSFGHQIASLAMLDSREVGPDVRYLVASSFLYDRFAAGASFGGPDNARAQAVWARYEALFRLPYCEIRPRFMSYGFSNPTLRIIDLWATPAAGRMTSSYTPSLGPPCAEDAWKR